MPSTTPFQSLYCLQSGRIETLTAYAPDKLAENALLWLNFAGDVDQTRDWLFAQSLLDPIHVEALCSELTRPRLYVDAEGNVMLTLRTARESNAPPLDFMSLRIWASRKLIITVARWQTDMVDHFIDTLRSRSLAINSTEQVLLMLCQYVSEDFTATTNALDDRIIELEDAWDEHMALDFSHVSETRQRLSRIARYLPPQLEAIQKLAQHVDESDLPKPVKRGQQHGWREVANSVRRDIEALGEMRERLTILKDNLQQLSSERINRTIYLLTLLSTFFLPLTFVAGLLGMNLSGIPAAEHRFAFLIVCVGMGLIALLQWVLFKRWRWVQ